jgi:hypothetical protein
MNAYHLEGCCGVLEIQNFNYVHKNSPIETIKKELINTIVDSCLDVIDWSEVENKKLPPTYDFFIATTAPEQSYMEAPLKALGFRARAFKSKHEGQYKLLFWSRKGLPREVKKEFTAQVKKLRKEDDHDFW